MSSFKVDRESPIYQLALSLAHADHELHVALVRARVDAGLSQQEIADRLGQDVEWVRQFERYDNDPRLSEVRRYALSVGASVTHAVSDDRLSAG